jgi:copper transport protein
MTAGIRAVIIRAALVLVVALGLMAGMSATATATSDIVAAQPVPGARLSGGPGALRLEFRVPVETHLALLEFWAHGHLQSLPAHVDPSDDHAVIAALPRIAVAPGGAWVRYRVLTGDGHVVRGRYPVEVGTGGSASAPPGVPGSDAGAWIAGIGRWLLVAGLVLLLGLVVMRWGVAAPAWHRGGVVPPGRRDDGADFRVRTASSLAHGGTGWWRLWWSALGLWAAGAVLYWIGFAVWAGAGAGGAVALLRSTRIGTALAVLGVTAAAAAVAGLVARRPAAAGVPAPDATWGVLLAVWAVVGICALSWQGHASDGVDAATNIPVDAVHTLATAAWVGGLAGLLVLVVVPGAALAEGDRVRLLAGAVVRFSGLAIACVALLVITGTYRALAELGSLGQLVTTAYGIVLSVKLVVFAVMLAAGGVARIVLHPRLERAALGLEPDDRGAARALRRSLGVELALAAAVLVTVAALLALTPPG